MGHSFVFGQKVMRALGWGILFGSSLLCARAGEVSESQTPQAIVRTQQVTAQLVSEVTTFQPGGTYWVGLHLKIIPDWHTYWKFPGDSGLPTRLSWKSTPGVRFSEILWPYPRKMSPPPVVNLGYENEVLHLVQVTVDASVPTGQNLVLDAKARWLVCQKTCIPQQGWLRLGVPVSSQSGESSVKNSPWYALFEKTRARLPRSNAALSGATLTAKDRRFAFEWNGDSSIQKAEFFPDRYGLIDLSAPSSFRIQKSKAQLVLQPADNFSAPVFSGLLVQHRKGQAEAIEVELPLPPQWRELSHPVLTTPEPFSVWVLFFAFLGGILLNLMPCVFPVLSIKILGFLREAQGNPRKAKAHAWAYSAGILVCVWGIALVLELLRAGGAQWGWGFQLQFPPFLVFLILLLFLMALNLSGFFELGASFARLGFLGSSRQGSLVNSFLTGVLAVIVATPCTAPFMGVAVGVALTSSLFHAILIFTCLGVGLALPYVLLSSFPSFLRFLPKSGAWMLTLKEVLAFPLYLSVAWLIWVLDQQVGSTVIFRVLGALVGVVFVLWIGEKLKTAFNKKPFVKLGVLVSLWCLVLGLAFGDLTPEAPPLQPTGSGSQENAPLQWEVFSKARLTEALDAGKGVLINFTARWCLTCLVNEKVAFSSTAVKARFKELDLVLLKADLTAPNPAYSRFLQEHQRGGIPFYLYFPKNSRDPKILPEVLTPQVLLKALQ